MLYILGMGATNVNAAAAPQLLQPSLVTLDVTVPEIKAEKKKKVPFFNRWKQKVTTKAISKGWLGEGEISEKQKRWAKWSMILGLAGLVLLFIPTVNIIAIPAAIVA